MLCHLKSLYLNPGYTWWNDWNRVAIGFQKVYIIVSFVARVHSIHQWVKNICCLPFWKLSEVVFWLMIWNEPHIASADVLVLVVSFLDTLQKKKLLLFKRNVSIFIISSVFHLWHHRWYWQRLYEIFAFRGIIRAPSQSLLFFKISSIRSENCDGHYAC